MSKPLALVTGASRGIGAAIARRLAEAGHHVILNYGRNRELAAGVLEEIENSGGSGELLGFDVSRSTEVNSAFDDLHQRHGALKVLVNNAGLTIDSLLLRLKDEDLERILAVDLKGAIYCTRAAAKLMMRERSGSIIQIASVVGECGSAGQSAYAAAKSGLMGFSKSIAKELGSRQIRVNVITPGYISTEMTDQLPENRKNAILEHIALGYLGLPDDIAHCVVFSRLN